MNRQLCPIYVVEIASGEIETAPEQWQVVAWKQHRALLPLGLVKHIVSTEAGDVELHTPYMPSRDRMCVMWAFAEVRRLHPPPTDLETLDTLTPREQLRLTLKLALEYVELAEDGRGHNDRSRYLARCLRQIASITPNSVGSTAESDEGSS